MEGDIGRVTTFFKPENFEGDKLDNTMNSYEGLYDVGDNSVNVPKRKENYMGMVNSFYDLVTNFYEFGWGHSFHFAPRHPWESFEGSIARHEMWLAHKLQLSPGKVCLDVGCGIGGPARTIARFSECTIVGLNNNAYQISRGEEHNKVQGLSTRISFLKADFMAIPREDCTFDAAYAIEATCHAPDKLGVYREIFRVLKPGGLLGLYEWVLTRNFDPNNADHVRIKQGIERGNGLPDLEPVAHVQKCITDSGFELLENRDLAESAFGVHTKTPWYHPLSGSFSLSGFKHMRIGRYLTNRMVAAMEFLRLAPKGTTEVSNLLLLTANDLVEGGQLHIFTPMHFFLCRKPAN